MYVKFLLLLIFATLSQNLFSQEIDDPTRTFYVQVDPRGTYLPPGIHPETPNPPTYFSLGPFIEDTDIQLQEGDLISLQGMGDFVYFPDPPESSFSLNGVFSGPGGFLSPAPGGTSYPVPSCPDMPDIPEDFSIPSETAIFAAMPSEATGLFFAANDCYFTDNSDPDGDFAVLVKIKIKKQPKYQLEKIISGPQGVEPDGNDVTMIPSIKRCSDYITTHNERRTLRFRCINTETGQAEEGCFINLSLSKGTYDGGHNHANATKPPLFNGPRPLGELSLQGIHKIPARGLRLTYLAPDISGQVKLNIQAVDPNGENIPTTDTTFNVKNKETLENIQVEGLYFSIASHAAGTYGLSEMGDRLEDLVKLYRKYAIKAKVPESSIPLLKSEAGSLPWGGLFDYEVAWKSPHCNHRFGNVIDISIQSVFNGKPYEKELKDALEKALIKAHFHCWNPSESPDPPAGVIPNHWHLKMM